MIPENPCGILLHCKCIRIISEAHMNDYEYNNYHLIRLMTKLRQNNLCPRTRQYDSQSR